MTNYNWNNSTGRSETDQPNLARKHIAGLLDYHDYILNWELAARRVQNWRTWKFEFLHQTDTLKVEWISLYYMGHDKLVLLSPRIFHYYCAIVYRKIYPTSYIPTHRFTSEVNRFFSSFQLLLRDTYQIGYCYHADDQFFRDQIQIQPTSWYVSCNHLLSCSFNMLNWGPTASKTNNWER